MARKYQLKQRAEQQEDTRQRIVEAAVELHTTVGPARTSIQAIAKRAGVERPTVYRHFPTTESLFTACSSHHWAQNPAPDPATWMKIANPSARLRKGIGEIYDYYSANEVALWNILRDVEDEPWIRRFATQSVRHREQVMQVLASAWPNRKNSKLLSAALGHATDFFAWRSLRRQGLTNEQAVELMVAFVQRV